MAELEKLGYISEQTASKASNIGNSYDVAKDEIEATSSGVKSLMNAVLESEEDYYKLGEGSQSFLKKLIGSMDAAQVKELTAQGADSLASSVKDILSAVANNADVQSAINQIFALEANASSMTLQDYASLRKDLVNQITSGFSDTEIDADAVINILP